MTTFGDCLGDTVGDGRLPRRIAHPILPHFYAEIGDAVGLRVKVHRMVEQLSRVRKLVANGQPECSKRRNGNARQPIVVSVEDTDLPGPRLTGMAGKAGREAVQRQDHRRAGGRQRRGDMGVIGEIEAV